MFTVGDKVKFLNSSGGGVISRIIDPKMVAVTTDDGFEIPTLISELVRVEGKDAGARFFGESFPAGEAGMKEDECDHDGRTSVIPESVARSRKREQVFLAFVPHDQKWLITGLMDIYLVNNTSWDVIYNLFLREPDGNYSGSDYGSLFANTRLLISTIEREELPRWTNGTIQLLFHKESTPEPVPPFNAGFRIQGQKFYHETSYRESGLVEGKAMIVRLFDTGEKGKNETAQGKRETGRQKQVQDENEDILSRYLTGDREAVVDLHIQDLVEDPSSFEKGEILDYQLNITKRCMESALLNHFLKITFIHGVGNGILRKKLEEMMKNYPGTEFLDAPMVHYGTGALEVRIPHNI